MITEENRMQWKKRITEAQNCVSFVNCLKIEEGQRTYHEPHAGNKVRSES